MMCNLKKYSISFMKFDSTYFTIVIFVFVSARDLPVIVSFFLMLPPSHDSLLISVSFHSGQIGAKRNRRFSIGLNDNAIN